MADAPTNLLPTITDICILLEAKGWGYPTSCTLKSNGLTGYAYSRWVGDPDTDGDAELARVVVVHQDGCARALPVGKDAVEFSGYCGNYDLSMEE